MPEHLPIQPLPGRREFLRRLALLAGAGATLPAMRALAQNAGRPLEVIVAGAGMAGLCAAYELEQRGHRVSVLEADRRHIGGRVRTLRFEHGLYGEAGAMRIPEKHALTRRYIAQFGLQLRPFVMNNPQGWLYARGTRVRAADALRLGERYALAPDERGKTADELWSASLVRRLGELSAEEKADLASVTPQTPRVREYDQQSLLQLCQAAGLSDEACEFLAVAYGLETLLGTAATEHLREELNQVWSLKFDEIVGGTDTLATAFARSLHRPVRSGCEIHSITQDAARGRVAALYRENGEERKIEGDYLICTLPCPVLARLRVEPDLSGAKRRAIRQLNYDSSTKVLALTNRRFWEIDDGIYGGGSFTDLISGSTYYPADNAQARDLRVSRAPAVMLASYTWGQGARRLGSLTHPERSRAVLHELARVHPQLAERGSVLRTASWSWDAHPFANGAFAWFMPGQHSQLHRHIVAAEGRIFFAGEHASLTHTWIQGALESALHTVAELLQQAASEASS
ncbi:MAG: FAD-dependent oxidoreductase [Rhodocyclaceae bacterium]|nr:FAD-dependent oxidoreductase [Rhodocyclaceae bacterium]MBX3667846.1 FAD-dependent oxidoreductase [Rhodocyclaceae bacterium]